MAMISAIRSGFSFQDVVAFAYFLRNIKDIRSITDEGHDDIDVEFNNKYHTYIQAKYSVDINSTENKSGIANKAINSLVKDYFYSNKNSLPVYSYIYATNSNLPFGVPKGTTRSQISFRSEYNYLYSINDLDNKTLENNISKRITNKVKDQNNGKILSDGKNNKTRFKNKFFIFKYFYHGKGKSRLKQLMQDIYGFVGGLLNNNRENAIIYGPKFRDHWLNMLNENAGDGKTYKITKKTFVAYTAYGIITFECGDMSEFYDRVKLGLTIKKGFKEIRDIRQSKSDIKSLLLSDFYTCSKLTIMFNNYAGNYVNMHGDAGIQQILAKFLNNPKEIYYIKNNLFGKNEDICIIQYVTWELITEYSTIKNVEDKSGYNNQ